MKHLILFILLSVFVVFQNCGKVEFYSSNGTLMPKTDNEEVSAIDDDVNSDEPSDEPSVDEPPIEEPPVAQEPEPPGNSGQDRPNQQGNGRFICILEGPGKSVRLGISSELMLENGHTPDTVCMSERACREIVSQKFQVKGPEERGFCPDHNPHVISMTDEQIQEKINSL